MNLASDVHACQVNCRCNIFMCITSSLLPFSFGPFRLEIVLVPGLCQGGGSQSGLAVMERHRPSMKKKVI